MEKGLKRRRTASEMEILVEKWEASGQSRAVFCLSEGIPSWIFQYWLGRHRKRATEEAGGGFTEIRVKGPEAGRGSVRIKHPCGLEVELCGGTSASYLRELLGW